MSLFIEVNAIGNPSKQLLVNVDSIKWVSQGEGMDGARLFLCDKEFDVMESYEDVKRMVGTVHTLGDVLETLAATR